MGEVLPAMQTTIILRGTQDFKWLEWSNGQNNQNTKKSLGFPTKPKKLLDQKFIVFNTSFTQNIPYLN